MHRFTDFKNFRRAEVDLSAPLTILLGRNGSGKANLIEGVEVMGALARGASIADITELGRDGRVEVRGGLVSCQRFGAGAFGLRLDLPETGRQRDASRVTYSIEMTADSSGVNFARESLHLDEKQLFTASRVADGHLEVVYDDFSRGPNPEKTMPDSSSILARYSELIAGAKGTTGRRNASAAAAAVVAQLWRPYVFDLRPKEMRNYERVDPRAQLTRTGSNLSSVLFSLKKGDEERAAALDRVTAAIAQISEEPFREISFVESPLGDVIAGLAPASGGQGHGPPLVDARLLSDGTLQMLAVLAAIETVPEGTRLVIEEFDNGLHPFHAELVLDYLTEAATRRDLNVLLTTHNLAIMNSMKESHFPFVWICHRDDTLQTFRVTRLSRLDYAFVLSLTGGLGKSVVSGRLDNRLDPDYERKREEFMRKWIASFS